MTSGPSRNELLDELAGLRDRGPVATYGHRAPDWFRAGRALRVPRSQPIRRWFWPLAMAVAAAFVLVRFKLSEPNDPRAKLTTSVVARADGPDSAPLPAVVIGPDPLVHDETGVERIFASGDALPVGLLLHPLPGRTAMVRIGERISIHADSGAAFSVGSIPSTAAVAVEAGRIGFDIDRAPVPLHVTVPAVDAALTASSASFAVLATAGRRWSVAVMRGEVRLERPAPTSVLHAPQVVGGAAGAGPSIQSMSGSLNLTARIATIDRTKTVEGLTHLLARVEVDGHEVAINESGRFRAEITSARAPVLVVATDVTGRRATRHLGVPTPVSTPRQTKPAGGASAMRRDAPIVRDSKPTPHRGAPSDEARKAPLYVRPKPLEW